MKTDFSIGFLWTDWVAFLATCLATVLSEKFVEFNMFWTHIRSLHRQVFPGNRFRAVQIND